MVAIVGMMGNLAAILILLRPEMKSTFHHSLITLAVVDILFVITLLIDIQRFDLDIKNQMFILFFPYAWNPFKNILMTFETFLMVSITTERYLAIRSTSFLNYFLWKLKHHYHCTHHPCCHHENSQ